MFEEMNKMSETFGKVFADQSMKVLANTVNFHIGIAPNCRICYDVNGTNPQKVAEGFNIFEAALKRVGMVK